MDALFGLPLLAHILIGFYFVFFGIWNIYHWTPILEVMIKKTIPHPYLLLSLEISCQIIIGFMIICGILVKLAALLLIPFNIIFACLFHPFWKFGGELKKLNFTIFVTNMTISLGALLLLMTPIYHLSDFFA